MNFRLFSIILCSVLLLQGCVGAVVVGTAAVATKTTTDPRSTGTQLDDTTLEMRVSTALSKNNELKQNARIIATAYNGRLLLTGQAPNDGLIHQAQQIAQGVDGVGDIYNEVRYGSPIGIAQVSQDSWITTKIRSKLLTSNQVKSSNVKVVTENGEVFLLGLLTERQSRSASELASQTNGVKKVITVFEFVR